MPVVSISRWHMQLSEVRKHAKDAAEIFRKNGATSVQLGYSQAGEHAGQCYVSVTFPDAETYGRALAAQMQDPAFQRILDTVQSHLQSRTLIITEDL